MNAIGYFLVALGFSLLLCSTKVALQLLVESSLTILIWVIIWWVSGGGGLLLLNRYAPADVYYSLEHFINPMVALFSWFLAYPLCLLIHRSIRSVEGFSRIFVSMVGSLALWRIIIYSNLAEDEITRMTTLALTFVSCPLLMARRQKVRDSGKKI